MEKPLATNQPKDDKSKYISFRISYEEFLQIEVVVKFLHAQKNQEPNSRLLAARSVPLTEIIEFAKYFEDAKAAVLK